MKAAIFAAVLLALAPAAHASHFRYGALRWAYTEQQPYEPNLFKVNLQLELAMRFEWPVEQDFIASVDDIVPGAIMDFAPPGKASGQYALEWGDGTFSWMEGFEVTVADPVNDVLLGSWEAEHTFEKGGSYDAYYTNCCRLAGIGNNAGQPGSGTIGPWYLEITIEADTDGFRSPVASWLPVIELGDAGMQYLQMDALPPTAEAALKWSLADEARMAGVQPSANPAYYGIDPNSGVLWFDGDWFKGKGGTEELFCTQILVAGSLSEQITVPVDFFLRIVPAVLPVCVGTCSNAGVACSLDDMSPCAGDCVGQTYDACQGNILPQIVSPDIVNRYIEEEVTFEVNYLPNTPFELYQSLTMATSSMPAGAEFTYTPHATDEGYGTFVLSAEKTVEPKQFIACFAAYDDIQWGPPSCTKVNIMDFQAGPNWFCHNLTHTKCNANNTCTWDKPWRVCRGVHEYADMPESYEAGVDHQRYIGDPCRWFHGRANECKRRSMCDWYNEDAAQHNPHKRTRWNKCSFKSIYDRISKRGRESWSHRQTQEVHKMATEIEYMLCGEAFTQHDCQNLNEFEIKNQREPRCTWEEKYVMGVGYPYCRPRDQIRINVGKADHPDDYAAWIDEVDESNIDDDQHRSKYLHYPF